MLSSNKRMQGDGFTLVEILIALAILAMLVASTFTIFRSASKSWQKGEQRTERYHNARVAIGRMSMEISQAVIPERDLAGFIGERDRIHFLSFISTSGGIFEVAEIGYWLDSKDNFLMRSEDTEPDYDFLTMDYNDVLAEGVSELEFLYYDGITWSESWNSDERKEDESILPEAVKIKIKIEDRTGRGSEIFEVVTRLKTV